MNCYIPLPLIHVRLIVGTIDVHEARYARGGVLATDLMPLMLPGCGEDTSLRKTGWAEDLDAVLGGHGS